MASTPSLAAAARSASKLACRVLTEAVVSAAVDPGCLAFGPAAQAAAVLTARIKTVKPR